MSRGMKTTVAMVAMVLLAPAGPASAQIGSGTITGVIADASGAAVADAAVAVRAPATGFSRSIVSGAAGDYVVAGLAPGVYEIHVTRAGFRPHVRTNIRLATGEALRVDMTLDIGATDTVTVAAGVSMLRSQSSGLGHVVDQTRIVGLPLNGRSLIALASLVPGVALPPPPAAPLPRINGGRPRTNEYLFDGISVLQPEPGQVAFFPNIDAVQEFNIETNSPPAEFGRFNGGVVNLTTKAGTNRRAGTMFDFARHEALNARNAFAAGGPAPTYRRQQFGGVAGGPVRRNRTFFFTDYQGQRQTIGRTAISTVPTLLQRQGIFTEAIGSPVPVIYDPATGTANRLPFPGNTIPASRFDPVARALLDRYPLPTSGGTANNYRRIADETVDQDQFSLRLDHRLGDGRQAFARLTRFRETFLPVTPLPDGSGLTSGTLGPQDTTAWSFASAHRRAFAATVFNELRAGDTRRRVVRSATGLGGPVSAVLGLPGLPATARFAETVPTFLIAGYEQLGSAANTAANYGTSVTEVADTLTWIRGRHTVKAGFDLRWSRLNALQPPSPTGVFTFSSLFTDLPGTANTGTPLASFLLGQVQQFSIDLQQDEIRNRAHIQEYFVQDDWRLSDQLTLNAGLRYTLNFPSHEVNDQAGVFNLETRQMEYAGVNGVPRSARELHWNNLGPRVGVVGRLTDSAVARAGYGLTWIEMAGITTPFTTPVFPFLQTVSQRALDNLTPAFTLAQGPSVTPLLLTGDTGLGQGVFSVDRDLGSGYVQQWNVAVQEQLSTNVSIEVAYVGSKGTRVGLPDTNLNQLSVEQLALGRALLQRVPNPYFGQIPRSSSLGDPTITVAQLLKPYPQYTTVSLYRNNVGTTIYHGVYVTLQQRLSHGLTGAVNYTRSTLRDDASAVFDASILTGPVANFPVADSFDRARERDHSTGDIRHAFTASVVWDLPFGAGRARRPRGVLGALTSGWTLSGIATLQSGVPLAISQTTNHNAFAGFGTQRPNLVGDAELPAGERTASRWFNTAAFTAAPQFSLGTSSRNPVRGPGYRNLDLAIARRIGLPRSTALELRGEVFNATNTTALGAPNTTVGSAAFGSITSAGDPRVVQLAAKLLF